LLENLFRTAIAAAHPAAFLASHLPQPPKMAGRLIVLAAGKAAGSMTEVAEAHYLGHLDTPPKRLVGLAVTRYGYGRPTRRIELIAPAGRLNDDPARDSWGTIQASLARGSLRLAVK
jgi:hydroxypyruvate reductase